MVVIADAKILILKQITTRLFPEPVEVSCYCRCKDTNFKANHNSIRQRAIGKMVVIADAKILILKQITTIKLAYAKQAHELITKATLINPNEPSIDHPDSTFIVYEYIDDCYHIEIKIKCNRDGNFMHIIRVYKK